VISILITIFVGIILAVAIITFARDTKKNVIKPVNKMVKTIKNLAKDPLKISEVVARPVVPRESILEETIDKIGILLKINFGT
jgi:F0F1-type ATP synthase delta subunit